MRANVGYDIELYGTRVYVYAGGDKVVKQSVIDLFSGADALLDELYHKGKTFRLSRQLTPIKEQTTRSLHDSVNIGGVKVHYGWIRLFSIVFAIIVALAMLSIFYRMFDAMNSAREEAFRDTRRLQSSEAPSVIDN
jgi:hypothetical protein